MRCRGAARSRCTATSSLDRPAPPARGAAMRLLTLAAALAALVPAAPALAWGQFGHQTVAQIAYRNVRPATRRQIDRLIRASAALDVGKCAIHTLDDASTWPDCIRGYR